MIATFESWLTSQGMGQALADILGLCLALTLLLLAVLLTTWGTKRFFIPLIESGIKKSAANWDDTLVKQQFFGRLAYLVPTVVAFFISDIIFSPTSSAGIFFKRTALIVFVIFGVRVMDALLKSLHDILCTQEFCKGKPLRGYIQAITIVIYIMAAIFIVAIATNQSPWGILTVLGGLTAVLILVFKDTLLGLVASIQLSANDMVRVGDWIEMPTYGADGDVIDVSINTIKVRNWDKTIATIPAYALISDSFKNWRGMDESGGRRIKRSIFIDMNSVKFCNEEMLDRFAKFRLLKEYLPQKQAKIDAFNKEKGADPTIMLDGRHQTNVGIFRAYIIAYLRQHPKIHQEMTFLVRHLQPTPQGLPIEIYVFSNDQEWANYEAIQADILDHILAAVPQFDLRIFQYPSGFDLGSVTNA